MRINKGLCRSVLLVVALIFIGVLLLLLPVMSSGYAVDADVETEAVMEGLSPVPDLAEIDCIMNLMHDFASLGQCGPLPIELANDDIAVLLPCKCVIVIYSEEYEYIIHPGEKDISPADYSWIVEVIKKFE